MWPGFRIFQDYQQNRLLDLTNIMFFLLKVVKRNKKYHIPLGGCTMNISSKLIMSAAFVLMLFCIIKAEELYLTLEDDVNIVLKTSHKWRYEKDGEVSQFVGKPIILDDGNIIVLNKNGTWGYEKTGKADHSVPSSQLQSLNAVGMAMRSDLSEARAAAMETAMNNLAKQLSQSTPDIAGVELQVITECLGNEEREIESSDVFKELYKVTVKLSVDEAAIRNALHCIRSRSE
jgi:hypothetical protein